MKKAYYFSHDAYARHSTKMVAMLSKYKTAGYGLYWMLKEMMRESDENNYSISISGKYDLSSLSKQTGSSVKKLENFIYDCINEFKLFESDGEKIWSPDLLTRMGKMEEISNKRQIAATARWGKKDDLCIPDVMQMDSKCNADAEKRKEMKRNERKTYENKINDVERKKDKQDEIKVNETKPVILDDNIFFSGDCFVINRDAAEELMKKYRRTAVQLYEELESNRSTFDMRSPNYEVDLDDYFRDENNRPDTYFGVSDDVRQRILGEDYYD